MGPAWNPERKCRPGQAWMFHEQRAEEERPRALACVMARKWSARLNSARCKGARERSTLSAGRYTLQDTRPLLYYSFVHG